MARYNRPMQDEEKPKGWIGYADPSMNLPMTQNNMTPQGEWDAKFANRQTGTNLVGEAAGRDTRASIQSLTGTSAPTIAQEVQAQAGINPLTPWNNNRIELGIGGVKEVAPPISETVAGGMNHAQKWTKAGEYNAKAWGGSTTFSNEEGTRKPFIAGADGKDVSGDYMAGGKFSSYKIGSDPTLDRGHWATAGASVRTPRNFQNSFNQVLPTQDRLNKAREPISGFKKIQGNVWPFSLGA